MKELRLTPVELFYLGVQMQARYIDYGYIAAMPDIQKRYALHEQETLEELEERGLIEVDFGGAVEVEEGVRKLLTPVFMGDTESRVAVDDGPSGADGGTGQKETEHPAGKRYGQKAYWNVHTCEGRRTAAVMEEERIHFFQADEERILGLIEGKDVTVSCAKVTGGVREKKFTAKELKDKSSLAEALRIVKGEY